ncbi:MAG: choice-of-anchor Q domain-containing protein, partial [Cyanobacteria bacterium J06648_1]
MDNNQGQNFINTFIVTTANDENDGANNGTGLSLREAVNAANNSAGIDRIIFDSGLSGSNITLSLGEIAIADSVAIEGLGADALTIDGANASRVFNIDDGDAANTINVSLSQLTVANGTTTGAGGGITNSENLTIVDSTVTGSTAANRGGGIYNLGDLTVKNSIISENRANERTGGGIVSAGNLTIEDSVIRNNFAYYAGGGVSNDGQATISNTLIDNNSSDGDGGGILNLDTLEIINTTISNNSALGTSADDIGSGGGIINVSAANLSITSSTISGNTANFSGGGVYNQEAEDTVVINNSTISDNQATYGGGVSNSGTATISSSTISGNSASISGGGIDNYQGNVDLRNSTISNNTAETGAGLGNTYGVEFSVTSTIVAGNTDDDDLGGDPFTSGGNNLIGNGDGAAGFVAGTNSDLVGDTANPIDPKLGALQDNGGATATQALLADSPAIDAGSNPDNLTFDQRGNTFTRTN